jgi:hypothetical protein
MSAYSTKSCPSCRFNRFFNSWIMQVRFGSLLPFHIEARWYNKQRSNDRS